ncbi:MAG: hypothetical protein SFU83_06915 [Meiothermus sp.]|nr:hypothetical protein [Meiothermus sp.]
MAHVKEKEIKTVSSSGQISLGKAYAGETVALERLDDGRWVITPVQVIPKHLMWANTPEVAQELDQFLSWKGEQKLKATSATQLKALAKKLEAEE